MIYAFVQITVTDPEAFAAYGKQASGALAKYGAKPEAMSTAPTRLEGEAPAPGRAVLLAFPNRDAALGWINDPELADIHALRRKSGPCEITLIG
ncbi:MAG: DUF1330 domain-containing protein [Pelagimonas sp.]|uniref:DUF1330 domain-containing protein n=1 Tax=Pelagimonas sp. TaxID=2073170 RepID=UPI003D6B1B9A